MPTSLPYNPAMPDLIPYRRHSDKCKRALRKRGINPRQHIQCNCPCWVEVRRDGRQTRESLNTRNWKRAIRRLGEIETPGSALSRTIADALKAFKDSLEIESSTLRKYSNTLRHFETYCETAAIEDTAQITTETFDDYFKARRVTEPKKAKQAPAGEPVPERKLSRTTKEKEIQLFRQFCCFAQARGWMATNPAKALKTPKYKDNEVRPYIPEEIAALIRASKSIGRGGYERSRAHAMTLLLRYTALAISDIAMLERARVSGDRILVRRMKSGEHVFLPIRPDLAAALAAVPLPRDAQGNLRDSGYFFWNGITSKRAAVGIAERTMAAVVKASKVKGAHAHRFRHTLATELLGAGATYADVADVLGNSERIVRKHYAKWSPARQARITSLLDAVFAPKQDQKREPTRPM